MLLLIDLCVLSTNNILYLERDALLYSFQASPFRNCHADAATIYCTGPPLTLGGPLYHPSSARWVCGADVYARIYLLQHLATQQLMRWTFLPCNGGADPWRHFLQRGPLKDHVPRAGAMPRWAGVSDITSECDDPARAAPQPRRRSMHDHLRAP